jgi:hypothetical protein
MSSMERSTVSAGPRASAGMERDRMRIAILDEASIVGYCCSVSLFAADFDFWFIHQHTQAF